MLMAYLLQLIKTIIISPLPSMPGVPLSSHYDRWETCSPWLEKASNLAKHNLIRLNKSAINPTLVDGKGNRLKYPVMPFTD